MFGGLSSTDLLIVLGSILLAVSIHEAMHGFAAHWLGDPTASESGRLTLNPLKHIDVMTTVLLPMFLIIAGLPPFFIAKPVPFNPWNVRYGEFGVAIIGLAGPFTNLVLATLASLTLRLLGLDLGDVAGVMLVTFTQINVALFVFNMIPFPPLDGSRVLYAFAPEFLQRLMQRIESLGLSAIFIFMFVFFPILSPLVLSLNSSLLNILLG